MASVAGLPYRLLTALSMTAGRGAAARLAAELAAPSADDTLVDLGCGPGAAAREARRRGAVVVGVDPDPIMLALARLLGGGGIRWLEAGAESLPLPDESATVLWTISSLHDWPDAGPGLREALRVLAPGGRLLVLERLVPSGASGHAAHGLTREQADELAGDLAELGCADVRIETHPRGRRVLVSIRATR